MAQTLGFVVIVVLYAAVGGLAAVGSISLTRRSLAPKAEQVFYALFLPVIAAFYLAFAAYFQAPPAAWRTETIQVLVFGAIGLAALRLPAALIAGYFLHGVWDLLHELEAHGGYAAFAPGQLSVIPLAYGVFCLAFDFGIAWYFYARRGGGAATAKG